MSILPIDDEEVLEMLAKPVVKAFKERFQHLTAPQLYAIPRIIEGKNILLMAATGSGKTEAALLPILSKMLVEGGGHGIRLLYITPLRALNRDLLDRVDWWAQKLDLRVAVRHGDTASRERRIQTISPPDILITTPETLQVILTAKVFRNYLRGVKWVVVDEVHELATDKRGAQLSVALERLRLITGTDFQRIGLSATIGSPGKVAQYLVGVSRECEIIDASVNRSMYIDVVYPTPISEDYSLAEKLGVLPEVASRLKTIKKLIEEHESTLIFTNTRPLAEILTNRFRLWDQHVPLGIHHGSLSKSTRITAEHGLKSGELVGIICTSSLELGIDVGRIELCIQYNSPREVTRLVQRVGRSGHSLGKTAKGIVIVMDSDDALESIVITRRARIGELEEAAIPTESLDVLMHQVAGLAIEYNKIGIDNIASILRRSYNFKDLEMDELMNVLQHMSSLGIVEVRDTMVLKPRRSMELYDYYFSNLSMIPEEHQYLVIDEKNGESVGILDEEFVAEYGEPGTRFILTGRAWEILHTEGDRIYVSALDDYEGAVPSWVGDEIPVPFEVAQEVGALRREYAVRRTMGEDPEKIVEDIAERYGVGFDVIFKAFKEVEEHLEEDIPVPSDRLVLLEICEPYVILHIHGGLKANRTIQKVLAYYLSEKIGAPIHGQQNPYRIMLRSKHLVGEMVLEAIRELLEGEFEENVRRAVESSTLFKRRLIHVARKMGVIKSEASITDLNLSQFAETLKNTVVYREALNYTLFHDFDIDAAKKLLEDVIKGGVEVKIWRGLLSKPSPLARLTLSRFEHEGEITTGEGMKKLVLTSVKTRLLYESWMQVCTECFEYYKKVYVKDVDEKPACPVCGSDRIGVARCELEDILGLIARKGRPINKKERRILAELKRNSVLVQKYGRTAVIVLSARGLTLKEVVNILKEENRESLRLVELIIEAEKKALQKRFQ
ncbi:MAG: DEAD/DEAH box helicase [Nitrososphaerota archaeon]